MRTRPQQAVISTTERSLSMRLFTLAFSRDAETRILDFTRTHFTILAPLNSLLQFQQ